MPQVPKPHVEHKKLNEMSMAFKKQNKKLKKKKKEKKLKKLQGR